MKYVWDKYFTNSLARENHNAETILVTPERLELPTSCSPTSLQVLCQLSYSAIIPAPLQDAGYMSSSANAD